MGKYDKYSIPENNSFDPDEVKKDIEELERIARLGKLSRAGYAELAILKIVAEVQGEKNEEGS
jgi:hypothetical protein